MAGRGDQTMSAAKMGDFWRDVHPDWFHRVAGREEGGYAGTGGMGLEGTSAACSPEAVVGGEGFSPNPEFH